jgi:hypothetical protein
MAQFSGFRDEDFETLDGSSWRSRAALGGVLSRALHDRAGFDCESWGVRRRVELHLAQRSHYDFYDPVPAVKLFVYSYDELAFGLYLEATGKHADDRKYVHWQKFRDGIQTDGALRAALEEAIGRHDLIITDYYRRGGNDAPIGTFASTDGKLRFSQRGTTRWQASSVADSARAVGALAGSEWVNLHIYARVDKRRAIAMKADVVNPVVTVLSSLASVYSAVLA